MWSALRFKVFVFGANAFGRLVGDVRSGFLTVLSPNADGLCKVGGACGCFGVRRFVQAFAIRTAVDVLFVVGGVCVAGVAW